MFVLSCYNVATLFGRTAHSAFRQAEILFDAALFESCVGGVVGAMLVVSIFLLEFWFLPRGLQADFGARVSFSDPS